MYLLFLGICDINRHDPSPGETYIVARENKQYTFNKNYIMCYMAVNSKEIRKYRSDKEDLAVGAAVLNSGVKMTL